MRKKVDSRVRIMVEQNVLRNQRSLFVVVGDNGKDQVTNLHYLLSKLTTKKPSVLWCYKKDLGFSSNRRKRGRNMKKAIKQGKYDTATDDPFELFLSSTDIRFCYYRDSETILGKTYDMCVLSDFEALTPNLLCQGYALEQSPRIVDGLMALKPLHHGDLLGCGGIVMIMLRTMSSLKQLYSTVMDAHSKFRGEDHDTVEPRFNERFILSLADCRNCLVVDDELNVLPISQATLGSISETASAENVDEAELATATDEAERDALVGELDPESTLGKVVKLAKTSDQAKAVMSFGEVITSQTMGQVVSLTAARGRGKSASLGMAVALAITQGYSNVFVTAPSPENLTTLFEFVLRTFESLGYAEHQDYSLVQQQGKEGEGNDSNAKLESGGGGHRGLNKPLVQINVYKTHRQTIQYVSPADSKTLLESGESLLRYISQGELLVIDEAAAIPLPVVKNLLSTGQHITLMSSTVQGYEGTGRALSLKLIAELRKQQKGSRNDPSGRHLTELTLETPIRYASGDGLEAWLGRLLCLDATSPPTLKNLDGLPMPEQCELYLVNRDTLFSYHKASEVFLRNMQSLFVSSHYKNSPNDLLLMSDAPKHHVFALLPPLSKSQGRLPEVLVGIQVCAEGRLSRSAQSHALRRGEMRPSGDMIPWTLGQQYPDSGFGSLAGVRVVRIACHPSLQRKGYATEALRQLEAFLEGKMAGNAEDEEESSSDEESEEEIEDNSKDGAEKDKAAADLQNERIAPKKAVAPLLSKLSDVESLFPGGVDYLGTSFGLTLQLFNFWHKSGLAPLYVRQTANEITGECSAIMVRNCSQGGDDWLKKLSVDFNGRFVRLLSSSPFRHMQTELALSVVSAAELPEREEDRVLPNVDKTNILEFLSRYDIHRLQQYGKNLVDYHLVTDLIPVVSNLYFTHRLPSINLSSLQKAVLLGMGLQRRSVDDLAAKEFGNRLRPTQLLALFNKAIYKLANQLLKGMIEDIEKDELEPKQKTVVEEDEADEEETVELPENTLEEDQALAGKEVDKELLAKKRELLLDSLMSSQAGGSFEKYNVSHLDEDQISKGEKVGNRVLVQRDSADKKRKRASHGSGKGGKKAHK
ncbi:N-acetyltransferase 10 [Perkinsus chesapeaki]|uniref:RNA cytidine acetyltransferase n=1 Tax=Perkinsus chesapeaki TaxID=330153 RepID=A0A7J6LBE7_PERCH|nr:N-acetyltransferase 10 [Perkinsus chesapeaki]